MRLISRSLAVLVMVLLLASCVDAQGAMDIFTKNIHPAAPSTYDIGDNATRYKNGYFDNVTSGELWVTDNTSIHTQDGSTFAGVGGSGSPGPQGPAGPAGSAGSAGAAGMDGKTVRSGAGAPGGGLGVDGDFYINTTANTIYGPKTGGNWGSPTSIVGPAGAAGSNGTNGTGFTWRGSWVSGTSYNANDIAYHNGSSFTCILATNGTTSPDIDSTHWSLMALAGIRAQPWVGASDIDFVAAIPAVTNTVAAPDVDKSLAGKITSTLRLVYN